MAGKSFTIRSSDPKINFRAEFGTGAPTVVDGYGGWQVVARPKMVGMTEWVGRNPMAIEIPFLIDNWLQIRDLDHPGKETEEEVRKLEKLCGLGGHGRPPVCKVDGGGVIPHDETNSPGYHKWVVENVQWDRNVELRNPNGPGRRLRCGGTITIRQYKTSDDLSRLDMKRRSRKNSGGGGQRGDRGDDKGDKKRRIHKVRRGETLVSISNKYYKTPNKWKRIADANNIRDPRTLQVGDRLRIP